MSQGIRESGQKEITDAIAQLNTTLSSIDRANGRDNIFGAMPEKLRCSYTARFATIAMQLDKNVN